MKNHKYQRFGERNGKAKLTAEKVEQIREAIRSRDAFRVKAERLAEDLKKAKEAAALLSNERIAKRLGVTRWSVRNVIYGGAWKHIRA
jgi:DNA-binding Lrp family transcriptional regulator